jgi:uncharacterized protein (DUF1330 family)
VKSAGLKTGHHTNSLLRFGFARGSRVKYYFIGELEITDQSWVPDYVRKVTGMVERSGGRYLSRTSRVERVEGERKTPAMMVILEWPSKELAMAFYESEEYRPYRKNRIAGAKCEFVLVAGEDVTKMAHIPE